MDKKEKTIELGLTCTGAPVVAALARPELNDAKFLKFFEKKIRDTIRKYELLDRKQKIGVAVSGGKDSTACLSVLKNLGYDVEAITVDAKIGCYTEENLKNIKKVCKGLKVKLKVISFVKEFGMSLCYMRDVLKERGHNLASCMICGTLRRYLLNKHGKKLKYDILVTGHNLDDEAQAFVMNVFRNDAKLAVRQGPISGLLKSNKFVTRVKPLYQITESEVIRYAKIKKFPVQFGMCPCSAGAYRREYLEMLDGFEKRHPNVKYNILRFHEQLIMPLKKAKSTREAADCENCGEPCSQKVCKACEILNLFVDKDDNIKKPKLKKNASKKR